jgi:CBS-domain-containing membrane protein
MMITEVSVGDSMKRHVVTVTASTTVQEAVRIVVEGRVGTLPVVDEEGLLTGVVRLADLLGVFTPDFLALLDDIDFVHDFGAMEQVHPETILQARELTMSDLAGTLVAVEEHCGLLHALVTMVKHQLQDLPIVDEQGRLVGIASRVDIARSFFVTRVLWGISS